MSEEEQNQTSWNDYYQKVADRKPRELLAKTLAHFGSFTGFAVDLGCGAGVETVELLRHGWKVMAVDKQQEALEFVLRRVPDELRGNLETHLSSMEDIKLPPSDLVWASASLPFCLPEHFDSLWQKIMRCLRTGERFAGDFFGQRHVWANNPQMTFHTQEQIKDLLKYLEVEYLNEEDTETPTAFQGRQRWHAFEVIARRR